MLVYLTGIVEDGSTPNDAVISNPRATLKVPRGTSLTITLALFTRSGIPIETSTVDSAVLTAKRQPQADALLRRTGVATPEAGNNIFQFTLSSADLSTTIDPAGLGGRFLFDAKIVRGSSVDFPVPLSALYIEPTAGI